MTSDSSVNGLPGVDIRDVIAAALLCAVVRPDKGADVKHHTTVRGVPLLLVGEFGIAKTSMARQVSEALGLQSRMVLMASKDPVHFYGVPVAGAQKLNKTLYNLLLNGLNQLIYISNKLVSIDQPFAKEVAEDTTSGQPSLGSLLTQVTEICSLGEGVVILDEVGSCNEQVQAAAMGMVNERKNGNDDIPNKVRWLLTANPAEIAANGTPLHPGFINRICKVTWGGPTDDEWLRHVQGKSARQYDYADKESLLIENWDESWAWTVALIEGFMGADSSDNVRQNMPKVDSAAAHEPWTSRRSMFVSLCVIASCRAMQFSLSVSQAIVTGLVGASTAAALFKYIRDADIPDVQDVLSGKWKPSNRLDVVLVVTASVVSAVSDRKFNEDPVKGVFNVVGAWSYAERLYSLYPDIAAKCVGALLNKGYGPTNSNKAISDAAVHAVKLCGGNEYAANGALASQQS